MQNSSFTFKKYFFNPENNSVHLYYECTACSGSVNTCSGGVEGNNKGAINSQSYQFEEVIIFPDAPKLNAERLKELDKVLRYLHLAAGISYYKAFAPHQLVVEGYQLDEVEKKFFKEFYINGLGEFACENKLSIQERINFVNVNGEGVLGAEGDLASFNGIAEVTLARKTIVPIGGGKDSCVTVEELRHGGVANDGGEEIMLFSVGNPQPILDTVAVAKLPYIQVTRKISPVLIEINQNLEKLGGFNGHVPITGIIAFILAAAAVIYDFDEVAMSNEKSANVGNTNWDGREVNHQWSKSMEFENLFGEFLASHVLSGFRYYSHLRELSELEIAEKFAKLDKYHEVFTSCNQVFKLIEENRAEHWCCDCDKCRFVFLVLAPFMHKDKLVTIFGRNLLAEKEQISGYKELLGLSGHKPFECVGEIEESKKALKMLMNTDFKQDLVVKSLIGDV